MVILNAKNLTRGDVHRLLGLEPRLNGSFTPLLKLESLSNEEQQQVLTIQQSGAAKQCLGIGHQWSNLSVFLHPEGSAFDLPIHANFDVAGGRSRHSIAASAESHPCVAAWRIIAIQIARPRTNCQPLEAVHRSKGRLLEKYPGPSQFHQKQVACYSCRLLAKSRRGNF
jgi:hypothetical protein